VIRAGDAADIDAVPALWGGSRSAHAVTEDTIERATPLVERGALLVAAVDGEVVGALIAARAIRHGSPGADALTAAG
jgi:hypothetical protein